MFHSINEIISASEPTISAPQQSFESNQVTSAGDEVLNCPLCSYRCSVRKSRINHVILSTDIRGSEQGQCPSRLVWLALPGAYIQEAKVCRMYCHGHHCYLGQVERFPGFLPFHFV